VQRLALRIPFTVPILNICLSLGELTMVWCSSRMISWLQGRQTSWCLTGLLYGIIFLPFTLMVLSATFAFPPDLRACRAALQWDHFFRSKNEDVIRSIQSQLGCCGFNSMRDRAWPFPAKNVDAGTCERTSGFQSSCGPILQNQVLFVALMGGCASALNILLLVCPSKIRFKRND
jgi:hypothetical protein